MISWISGYIVSAWLLCLGRFRWSFFLLYGVAAGPGVPGAVRGPAAAPSDGGSDDGSDDGPEYTADQLLDFESEASAIAAEFLAQF